MTDSSKQAKNAKQLHPHAPTTPMTEFTDSESYRVHGQMIGQKLLDKRAVALQYQPETADDAPKIKAKGQGLVAQRMVELALMHDIPVIENADMAQMLSILEVESEIPPEAFMAIAEILRYIYAVKGKKMPDFE